MIDKLEMLLALAKEKHFGRAAETMGITQPTLSAGIRKLEEQLGVRLVQRGSRYGGLTPEGQRALEWARRIVGDSRRLRDEMRASHAGLAGHLRIAVIPTALTWAARLTAGYAERHPNVTFTVLSRSSGEILQMLDNLDVDAGITYLDNEPLGRMTTEPLYREDYALVCPPQHPLAARARVNWAELGDLRLCLLTPDMQNRRIINRNLMEAGVEPRVLVESNSTIVMVSNVLNGPFVTILPEDMARFTAAGHDLALVPIERRGTRPEVGLIAPHQDPRTPVLQALMKLAEGLKRGD
ncbi:LysR family transcriptional regulator [Pseudodonghicola xiamenensis]|uniref:LysR family transcriptional regulator n=1 Tax=Pseudodonghicola xiamenensis TaxID=337702 RepID=A0A8J3MD59_9RHOB|nr:LysR family transcriptional regulator [Pseudodonghicola xiamenensis]GHG80975.1 LysR family transcriptional regulator [Pseudodonghicola xiamenensis]